MTNDILVWIYLNVVFSLFRTFLGHFADYCKLRGGVFFVESLPMTPSGKLLRRQVREQAVKLKAKQQQKQ